MSREIDIHQFAAAHAAGALVVDVRQPEEYVAGHVPGTRLLPLATVRDQLPDLPTDQPVFVICASGNRSYTAACWLAAAGVDAVPVAGGTSGWLRTGRPVVRGPHAHEAGTR